MSKNTREFTSRWGNAIADDYQYCHVPGYILRNYSKCVSAVDVFDDKGNLDIKRGQVVGLDMQDMMFVIHVMAFKYDAPNGKATPGLPTIAEYAGLNVNTVRRIKQRLMSYGLLSLESSPGKADVYNFAGLHDQCVRLEQELTPIEGLQVTPPKIKRGNNFKGGSPPKIKRSTPTKIKSRRIKGISEGNENPSATPFDSMKLAIQGAFGWSKPTDNEWSLIGKAAKQLLAVDITPADIPSLHKFCKLRFDRFTPMALVNNASEWKKNRPPVVIPSSPIIPLDPSLDDGTPATPEQIEQAKQMFADLLKKTKAV